MKAESLHIHVELTERQRWRGGNLNTHSRGCSSYDAWAHLAHHQRPQSFLQSLVWKLQCSDTTRVIMRARGTHPQHHLFTPLPSGEHCLNHRQKRASNSFTGHQTPESETPEFSWTSGPFKQLLSQLLCKYVSQWGQNGPLERIHNPEISASHSFMSFALGGSAYGGCIVWVS